MRYQSVRRPGIGPGAGLGLGIIKGGQSIHADNKVLPSDGYTWDCILKCSTRILLQKLIFIKVLVKY